MKFVFIITLLLLTSPLMSQAAETNFTVDLSHPESHLVHITLKPSGFRGSHMTYQMPVWAPGAYSVTHYGRYVQNFAAFDKSGRALTVTQENQDRWDIESGNKVAEISYDVLDSHHDSTSLYFAMAHIDSLLVFANATAFFGYVDDDKKASSHLKYITPVGWQLATALDLDKGYAPKRNKAFNLRLYIASDYDHLADAPIMAAPQFQATRYEQNGALYDLVVLSEQPFPLDSLDKYVEQITAAETDFFHETPFKHYTFLVYAPTLSHLPSFAQGALEHSNSSDYLLINLPWNTFKTFGVSVFSHEFFHLWNVKRIHSSLLGPFDYTARVKTTSLWLAEGVTDYYAHSLLTRYGIVPPTTFYSDIKTWMDGLDNADSSVQARTLEDLSIAESDFDLSTAEVFYNRGPLVALMLDLAIRTKTHNAKSLDDVMRVLNERAKKGIAFKDNDLIHIIQEITKVNLSSFYQEYIAGSKQLPIRQYLRMMGLMENVAAASDSGSKKLSVAVNDKGEVVLNTIPTGSLFDRLGAKNGDRIASINGDKLTLENLEKLSALNDNLDTVSLGVLRGDSSITLHTSSAELAKEHTKTPSQAPWLVVDPNATPEMNAIRKHVVGVTAD